MESIIDYKCYSNNAKEEIEKAIKLFEKLDKVSKLFNGQLNKIKIIINFAESINLISADEKMEYFSRLQNEVLIKESKTNDSKNDLSTWRQEIDNMRIDKGISKSNKLNNHQTDDEVLIRDRTKDRILKIK